jgi:hypothetical protein
VTASQPGAHRTAGEEALIEHAATVRIRLTEEGAGAAASLLQEATDAPAGPTTALVAHLVCAPTGPAVHPRTPLSRTDGAS